MTVVLPGPVTAADITARWIQQDVTLVLSPGSFKHADPVDVRQGLSRQCKVDVERNFRRAAV